MLAGKYTALVSFSSLLLVPRLGSACLDAQDPGPRAAFLSHPLKMPWDPGGSCGFAQCVFSGFPKLEQK